jgi:hypothetical protein
MRDDIAQALLLKVLQPSDGEGLSDNIKYFQRMSKYKYDEYQQFAPGMRFIESFALWLNQFSDEDRNVAFDFIRNKLVFISHNEMNLLVASCYQDCIKQIIIQKLSLRLNIPSYKITQITNTNEFKILLRQSLFCGLSDGARTEIFRRANTGIISHEQIYQTYELSEIRAEKMQQELVKDITRFVDTTTLNEKDRRFKTLFLLDDFSASGISYLKFDDEENKLKGKINSLYENIFGNTASALKDLFDLESLDIHIILYMCTEQAKKKIEENLLKLDKYKSKPTLHCLYLIPENFKINEKEDIGLVKICQKDEYYDSNSLEDEHTGSNIKMGFSECALPLVLSHNCPNNSVSILWAYENSKFVGLFPRVPRHKVL